MKNIIFKSIILIVFVGMISFNISFDVQKDNLSEIILSNVDALAQGESGDGYSKVTKCDMAGGGVAVYCEGTGSLKCQL